MPTFILKGLNPKGRTRTTRVQAESGHEAIAALEAEGWTQLETLTDDVVASIEGSMPLDDHAEIFTAGEMVTLRTATPLRAMFVSTLAAWRAGWFLPVIGIVMLIGRLATGRSVFGAVDYVIALLLIFLAPILVIGVSLLSPAVRTFRAIQDAKVEARWEDVLQLCKANPFAALGEPRATVELTTCRAQALAGLGRRDAALEEIGKLEVDPRVERWIYLSRLSIVYDALREYDAKYEVLLEASEEAPDEASVLLALVEVLACDLRKPAEARIALEALETHAISPDNRAAIAMMEGCIELEEGKFEAARTHFERSQPAFDRIARGLPEAKALVHTNQTFLAIACARTGDHERARHLYAQARPFLEAHRVDDLIGRCREVIPQV